MVSARRRRRGVEIAGFGRMPTPEGCVKNGIVVNSSQLGEALARVARENGLRGKRMCLAVTSPAISFRELEVPAAKPRDLDRILAGEAAHLSASKQESLMDYVLLGSTEREGKQFFRAWCAVVPRSLVDGYRDAVRKAGSRPRRARWRTNTSSPRSCPRRRTPKAARSGWPARRRPSFPASFSSS